MLIVGIGERARGRDRSGGDEEVWEGLMKRKLGGGCWKCVNSLER